MSVRRLWADRLGSVVLAPVFVVLSVLILATIFGALFTTQSVAESSTAHRQQTSATRSAIAAISAELNTKTLTEMTDAITSGGGEYTPATWIPAPGEQMAVTSVTSPTADLTQVTFTVSARTVSVEYRLVPHVFRDGGWVPAQSGDTPERSMWMPARTITEAS